MSINFLLDFPESHANLPHMNMNLDKSTKRRFCRLGIAREGWTDGWQENPWDWIQTAYWQSIPFRWRPSSIWRRFSCWGWKRYTTIKPRTMPWNGWTEYGLLLPHVMFEVLVRYVEKQTENGNIDWVDPEVLELYRWWNEVFVPYHNRERQGQLTDGDNTLAMYAELNLRCKSLVDCSGMLWT